VHARAHADARIKLDEIVTGTELDRAQENIPDVLKDWRTLEQETQGEHRPVEPDPAGPARCAASPNQPEC